MKDIIMIISYIIIIITTKGKNIFQKNIKEKEDIKKHITALAVKLKMKK